MSDVSASYNPDTNRFTIEGLRPEEMVVLAKGLEIKLDERVLGLRLTGQGEFAEITEEYFNGIYVPIAEALNQIDREAAENEPCICDGCTIRNIIEIRESSSLN